MNNIRTTDDFINASPLERKYFFKLKGIETYTPLAKRFRCTEALISLALSGKRKKKLRQITNSSLLKKLLANGRSKVA